MSKPNYQLLIEPDGRKHSSPDINRLRMLLKALIRGYGFRLVEAKEVGTAIPASAPTDSAAGDRS